MANKTKHTPGPWIYAPTGQNMQDHSQPFAIAELSAKNLIAGVFGDVRGGAVVAEANARLMTASPKLLSALEDMMSFHEPEGRFQPSHYKPFLRKSVEAIAEAKGQGFSQALDDASTAYSEAEKQRELLQALRDARYGLETAQYVAANHRLAGTDQNPKGWRDQIGLSLSRVNKAIKELETT